MGTESTKYPNNSNRAKERKDEVLESRVTKKVSGTLTKKKNSPLTKFASIFIPDDVDDVKEYIVSDLIIPTIKSTFLDAVEIFVNGGTSGRSRRRGGSRVSYSGYYKDKERRSSDSEERKYQRLHEFDNVIVPTRADAEEILDELYGVLDEFDLVRVADLYDLVGITDRAHTAYRYGWTSLDKAHIRRVRDGFEIVMPNARPID